MSFIRGSNLSTLLEKQAFHDNYGDRVRNPLLVSYISTSFCSFCLFVIRYEVMGYDDEVNNWFSNAIGQSCTLLRFSASNHKLCPKKKNGNASMCRDMAGPISFANEAQLLLVSEESTYDLNNRISTSTVYNHIHFSHRIM